VTFALEPALNMRQSPRDHRMPEVQHFLYREFTRRGVISLPFDPIRHSIAHKTQRWHGSCLLVIVQAESKGGVMENKKKWMELCDQAADEQDPKKLAALILEINFMLEEKEMRLTGKVVTQPPVKDSLSAD